MIDDLDRCEPETAYQLLEGIKIYLNLPSCLFVLGMNQRLIEQAVAKHLAEQDPAARRYRAREYLEKLCQVIWHLPVVRSSGDLLSRYLEPGVPGSLEIVQVVSYFDCLPRNPRKIKAFANVLLRFHQHWMRRRGDDHQRWAGLVVIFAYLYHFQNRIYRVLEAQPSFYRELERWCKDKPTPAEKHFQGFKRRRSRIGSGEERPIAPAPDTAPTPADEQLVENFLDPAAPDVLHVEQLIAALTVTDREVKDYLPA